MKERIQRLNQQLDVGKYPLCIEKSRLLTESFRKTESEPRILRRAKALAHILDNITIFIEDDELIVGNAASKPMGLEFDFYAGLWPEDELEKIAVTCRRVPGRPATTFAEAIQALWFTFLMVTPSTTASLGRFDQYRYPLYKKDIEAGTITDDEVLELLQCLRIKDMQINRTSGKLYRQKNEGMAGKSRISAYGMFIVPKVLEITMHNGLEPQTGRQLGPKTGEFQDFTDYNEFFGAFKKQRHYFLGLHAEKNNLEMSIIRELFPDPIRSSLMDEGVSKGKALLDRTFPFENGAVMNPVGLANVVDSLAAVKRLVYDEKKYSAGELMDALKADWQGNGYEAMQKAFLAVPKFGNNDDAADKVAKAVFRLWTDTTVQFETCLGGTHKPTGVSISAQWPDGLLTGATPDGRKSGECLADGAVSAMRGRDAKGPTAVLNSAMKVNQIDFQAAFLNMKFHPSSLETEEDLRKLSFLIRIYFMQNGKHIQFNVVNEKTLRNAQKEPENHKDLLVRTAGYSAHFIQLGKPMQEEIIQRMAHDRL